MTYSEQPPGKAIHRETGQTFYYATRLLPARIREETYSLYGFFRIADEIVDDGGNRSPEEKREALETLRRGGLGEIDSSDPVVQEFARIYRETGISEEEVHEFIDAMLMDIDTNRYETYAALDEYMRGSAAAVGVMMTTIMDVDDPERTYPHAKALGKAFQLTNFIRDVREDNRELGRIYLPAETLGQHDVSIDTIEREVCTPAFQQAIRSELSRAEELYREGVEGIEGLPADCQFAVLLSAVLYAEHHRLIRRQEYDVLSNPPELSKARKLWIIARTWWNWKRFGDPVTVFRRVSAVEYTDHRSSEFDHGTPSLK